MLWIGCVWDEVLVTVDGFGAAMWEKYAHSQGFGDLGVPGGGGGKRRTGIMHIYMYIYIYIYIYTYTYT